MPFLIILIILIIVIVKSPKIRGKRGERKVKSVIGGTIEGVQYVINNLTLKNNETTSQIDHIVVNQRGVFVIETKNYSGRIYGSENQRQWTQVLAYGKVKNKLYNPLKQNATHVYLVKKIVGALPVYSLVVFVQNNVEDIEANGVIPLFSLRSELKCGENVLSAKQMKDAYNALIGSET
jgi:hypothetical protein